MCITSTNLLNKNKLQIYNRNKRLNKYGGNDYMESGTVRPDFILKDLIVSKFEILRTHLSSIRCISPGQFLGIERINKSGDNYSRSADFFKNGSHNTAVDGAMPEN